MHDSLPGLARPLSRRQLLQGGLVCGAALALPGLARAGEPLSQRYPDPLIEILDDRFLELRLFNASVERLATGLRWAEGPVWIGDGNYLLMSDIPNNRIVRWDEVSGRLDTYRAQSNFANGLTRDRQGRLIACEGSTTHGLGRRVTRTEHDGRITVLADSFDGKPFNSPNDVVVKRDGSIWFSDPPFQANSDYEGHRVKTEQPDGVYRIDGESLAVTRVIGDLNGPNGLAFSPDERLLYVAESGAPDATEPRQYIRVFRVGDNGRSLSGGELFHKIGAGWADGFQLDELGNLWCGAADGVHVIAPDATLLGKVLVPKRVSNLCFGDRYGSRLFLCASTALYALFTNTRGAVAY